MTSTDITTSNERLRALHDELADVYDTDGSHAMFVYARIAARRRGITEPRHIVYVVFSIAQDRDDRSAAASAIASYAARALLIDERNTGGFPEEDRAAYIAATTLLDFQDIYNCGGIGARELYEPGFPTFAALPREEVFVDGD